jgi:hypothetical protein
MSGQNPVPHLQGQVAMLASRLRAAHAEVERLRGRLRELEWAATVRLPEPRCVVCWARLDPDPRVPEQHNPGCWLAKEIANG